MKKKPFSLSSKLKSFSYAFNGLKIFFKYEQNALVHSLAMLLAIGLAYWLQVSALEWLAIVIVIGIVYIAEIFNSSVEQLADAFTREIKPEIKKVKDLAAGGVLLASVLALVVGLIIFVPKLVNILQQ